MKARVKTNIHDSRALAITPDMFQLKGKIIDVEREEDPFSFHWRWRSQAEYGSRWWWEDEWLSFCEYANEEPLQKS